MEVLADLMIIKLTKEIMDVVVRTVDCKKFS